jgi:hypothetical protein
MKFGKQLELGIHPPWREYVSVAYYAVKSWRANVIVRCGVVYSTCSMGA